jgi:ParB family transcriptional regulator, chromosome partitioning protein
MPEAPDGDDRDPVTADPAPASPDGPSASPVVLQLVAVGELAAHPGNVREDLDLSQEFVASVADSGVLVPLLVTSGDGDGSAGYRLIEGHRRLAAAVKAGLGQVPCIIDRGRGEDQARQFLDMALANGSPYRANFTAAEEAAALFAAHEAGASRTQIRKATGRKAADVKAALAAGGISAQTREAAGELTRQLSLDQLALLAEFDGDPGAVERILMSLRLGYGAEHAAERIRQERAEAAEHDQLVAELQAAGFTVTDVLPPGAVRVTGLQHDGQDLTSLAHASCPGRGVYFPAWDRLNPVHYCASPDENGHTSRSYASPPAGPLGGVAAPAAGGAEQGPLPAPSAEPDPDRRLVIEGNRAWAAATTVRHRWLASEFFARRSAPREAARFAARQLLAMPVPLHRGLVTAPARQLFEEITRQDAAAWLEICDTTTPARVPLLILAPMVTAYELAMTEAEGRNTWRTDRYSPCPREDAAAYLKFLAAAGYELSAIEQAVADGVPYTGDEPGPLPPEPAAAAGNPGITTAADLAVDGNEPGEDTATDDPGDVTDHGDPGDADAGVAA